VYASEQTQGTRAGRPTRGELLRRYRRLAGLTQEALAERTNYSVDYISKLERGQRRLAAAALDRLAEALGLGEAEIAALRGARGHPDEPETVTRPLAGREREQAELRRLLAGPGPSVLLLVGEPGIGKTRLLDEAEALAAEAGWYVVRGGCQPRTLDPFAPLTDALMTSLGQPVPPDRPAVRLHAERLGRLLSAFGDDDAGSPAGNGQDAAQLRPESARHLLFRAVTDYLHAVAGECGTLLILDDLHWAAPDALDLLRSLAFTADSATLRIIGAYRDTETPADAPLGAVIADLARASLVRVLTLDPLAEAEATQLVTQLIPAEDARRHALVPAIVRRAGGVPFYLVSYVEDVLGRDEPVPSLELPWTVAQVIRQRVLALPEPARELLTVVAVVGRTVVPALLVRVSGQSEETVIEALETAAAARLLEEDADGGYRFSHDLIRDTIEQELSAARRRLLHRRIAEALEHLPEWQHASGPAEVAQHFLQGGDLERAVIWSLRAGDRAAALFAHANAELQYRTAADLAREIGDEQAELEALDKLGQVLYRLGRFRAAVEPLEWAGEIAARLGDRERSIALLARSGQAYAFGGRAAEGLDRLLPVWRSLDATHPEAPPSGILADLSNALCALYFHTGRLGDALDAAASAMAHARASGNLPALIIATIGHGIALGRGDRVDEERQSFEHAAALAERLGDPFLRALAVYHQGVALLSADDFDQGERHLRRALDIAEDAELIALATFARVRLSALLVTRGRWVEARAEAERAEMDNRFLGPRPGSFYPLHALGRILLLQGERDAGLRHVHEALAMATRYEHLPGIVEARQTLAWQAMRDGRPAEAVARLEPALEHARAAESVRAPLVYAWALLELGDTTRAAEVLAAARQQATASRSRARLPAVLLHEARLAAHERRWESAVDALEQGVSIAQELGLPYDEALLLQEHGRLHTLRAEPEQASARLGQALVIFRRLGAVTDVQAVEQALDALAGSGHAAYP